jgi:hypothetical protein
MNRRVRILWLVALLPACGDSCGCGERPVTGGVAGGATAASTAPSVATGDGAVGHGDGIGEERYSDEAQKLRRRLAPMADSDERRQLEAAAKAIDATSDLGDPVDGKLLAGALPKSVEDYQPLGQAQTGVTPAELGSATVAARAYKDGKAQLNLKITDTTDAPSLRRDLSVQLTSVGNAPTGSQTGALEDGMPGVRAYHAESKVSRASALIAGRFLVEALVDNAVEEDDAWTAIREVEQAGLASAAKASALEQKKK